MLPSDDLPNMAHVLAFKNSMFVCGIVSTAVLAESFLMRDTQGLSMMMNAATGGLHPTEPFLASSVGDGLWDAKLPTREELQDACYLLSPQRGALCREAHALNDSCVMDEDLSAHYGEPVWLCATSA